MALDIPDMVDMEANKDTTVHNPAKETSNTERYHQRLSS
jgi:hypothetical protein